MDTVEHNKLMNTINSLVSKANGWDRIDKFFKENSDIKPIYEEVRDACLREQIYSVANIYIRTIEKLLERIDLD